MSGLTRDDCEFAPRTWREVFFDWFVASSLLLALAHLIARGCHP